MKVLISDNLHKAGVDILDQHPNIEVDFRPGLSPDELKAAVKDADGLAIRSATKVTADLINAAPLLKVVGRAGTGLDNVDIPAASKRGIVVMNTPGGNTITTAEHAISLMCALARNIPQAAQTMREGRWEKKKYQGTEILNKTLGVIGLGRIGRVVAERGLGLKMRVIGYDPFITKEMACLVPGSGTGQSGRTAGPLRFHYDPHAQDQGNHQAPGQKGLPQDETRHPAD